MEIQMEEHGRQYIVISLGGSIIVPDEIDIVFLSAFKKLIEEKVHAGFRFVFITGGGKVCRNYQKALKNLATPQAEELDWLGIYTTRLNAEFLRLVFGPLAYEEIVTNPYEVPDTAKPIIVGAGWKPGWSTDYDAVIVAGEVGAEKVINLSNINYVYEKDPKNFPDARPIRNSTWFDFRALLPKEWDPGLNAPFDPVAAKRAEELELEIAIMNGKNVENLRNYLEGKEFIGTVIR